MRDTIEGMESANRLYYWVCPDGYFNIPGCSFKRSEESLLPEDVRRVYDAHFSVADDVLMAVATLDGQVGITVTQNFTFDLAEFCGWSWQDWMEHSMRLAEAVSKKLSVLSGCPCYCDNGTDPETRSVLLFIREEKLPDDVAGLAGSLGLETLFHAEAVKMKAHAFGRAADPKMLSYKCLEAVEKFYVDRTTPDGSGIVPALSGKDYEDAAGMLSDVIAEALKENGIPVVAE